VTRDTGSTYARPWKKQWLLIRHCSSVRSAKQLMRTSNGQAISDLKLVVCVRRLPETQRPSATMEPTVGIEPMTARLQGGRSAAMAMTGLTLLLIP